MTGNFYLGQVATAVGWGEETNAEGAPIAACKPKKVGLPVLGPAECQDSVSDAQFLTNDKGCVGIIGGPSYICQVI